MNMIEKVARAMCLHDGADWGASTVGQTLNGCTPEEQREYWLDKARAAIEQLREPTEGMIVAGLSRANGFASAGNRMCNGYRGMIDAALSEPVTSPTSSGVSA
jgi:hypothetical protein